jgi:hypothetical protein
MNFLGKCEQRMSGKPSDIVEQLTQVVPIFNPGSTNPPWFNGSASTWQALLIDAANEIKRQRQEIIDLNVMKESYSRLYKQIYGSDYG